jgi:UDPglucose 6-dehydrogenase
MGAELVVYDPAALDNGLKALHKMGTSAAGAADPVAACVNADALIVATEWPLFRSLDWSRIVSAMRGRVVMDARQVIDSASAESAGLEVLVHGASSRASSRVGT